MLAWVAEVATRRKTINRIFRELRKLFQCLHVQRSGRGVATRCLNMEADHLLAIGRDWQSLDCALYVSNQSLHVSMYQCIQLIPLRCINFPNSKVNVTSNLRFQNVCTWNGWKWSEPCHGVLVLIKREEDFFYHLIKYDHMIIWSYDHMIIWSYVSQYCSACLFEWKQSGQVSAVKCAQRFGISCLFVCILLFLCFIFVFNCLVVLLSLQAEASKCGQVCAAF